MKRALLPLRSIALLLALTVRTGQAQVPDWLQLGAWEGSLQTSYASGQDQSHSDSTADQVFTHRNSSEQLSLRNTFSILDPGLASGSLGLTLGWQQSRFGSSGEDPAAQNAKLLGYAFDTSILGALPYNGTVFANRSQGISSQPFGRIETAFENRGLSLRLSESSPLRDWGYPYLSANLRLEQQHTQETSTSALGQTLHSDEWHSTLSHDGHKGYETADLDWRYELNRSSNPLLPQGDFLSQLASLSYSLDFGPTLNRRWDSRLSYNRRQALIPFSLLSANESLHVDHDSNLASNYNYQLTRVETALGAALSQTGAAQVSYRFFQNLAGQASATYQALPAGTLSSETGGLNYSYQKALPWNGRLSARASTSLVVVDSHLSAAQMDVNDEPQSAPAELGAGAGFQLKQAYVATSSIVVVDVRGGARLPTQPGVDYEVVAIGNFTKVVPLLTSALIRAGDSLEISYSYRLDPSLKYRTRSQSAGIGVDYGWIAFNLDHQQSAQDLLAGVDSQFLQDTRNDSVRLDLRGVWRQLQAQAGASAQRYDSTRDAYTQRRLYQNTIYRPASNLGLTFNAEQTVSDYTLPQRHEDARSAQLSLDWYTPGGWTTTAALSQRRLNDSTAPAETVTSASLRAQLRYGKMFIMSSFTYNDRLRGDFQMNNWNLDLNLTRDF